MSNQPVKSTAAEDLGDLSVTDPTLFQDLFKKKTEDPVFMPKPGCQVWNSITTLPKERLKHVIRTKTLVKDKQCAENVIKKIEEEEVAERIKQAWKVKERLETRARLMRQKEKNICKEQSGGVVKNYQPVGVTLMQSSISNRYKSSGQNVSQPSIEMMENSRNMMNIVSDGDAENERNGPNPTEVVDNQKGGMMSTIRESAHSATDRIDEAGSQKFKDSQKILPVYDNNDSPRARDSRNFNRLHQDGHRNSMPNS